MKSKRDKKYAREYFWQATKITFLVLGFITALVGFVVYASKNCQKCEEEKRIADSIRVADSIHEADSIALIKQNIDTITIVKTVPEICYINDNEEVSKIKHI